MGARGPCPPLAPLLALVLLALAGPARALQNVTAQLFGPEARGTLAAFGDFNSDKQTDLFVLRGGECGAGGGPGGCGGTGGVSRAPRPCSQGGQPRVPPPPGPGSSVRAAAGLGLRGSAAGAGCPAREGWARRCRGWARCSRGWARRSLRSIPYRLLARSLPEHGPSPRGLCCQDRRGEHHILCRMKLTLVWLPGISCVTDGIQFALESFV